MKYMIISDELVPNMEEIPMSMMTIMSGIAKDEASLIDFAYALMMEINTMKIKIVEINTVNSNT